MTTGTRRGRLHELVGDPVGGMAAAGALHHDPPVARLQRVVDQPAVVAERHGEQRDRHGVCVAGHGERVAGAGRGAEPHRTLPRTSRAAPAARERKAAGFEVSAFCTKRAAWISSFMTTMTPRPRAGPCAARADGC